MQGMNVVLRSPTMTTLHIGPVKKCILLGREEKAKERRDSQWNNVIRCYFNNGVVQPVQVPYIYCVCETGERM